MEFISSDVFNKIEFLKFNSTVKEFVGFTEFGVRSAQSLNRNQTYLASMLTMKDTFCKPISEDLIRNIRNKTGEDCNG